MNLDLDKLGPLVVIKRGDEFNEEHRVRVESWRLRPQSFVDATGAEQDGFCWTLDYPTGERYAHLDTRLWRLFRRLQSEALEEHHNGVIHTNDGGFLVLGHVLFLPDFDTVKRFVDMVAEPFDI